MKKLFIALSAVAVLSSCGGANTSTAEGAADAMCELMDQMVVAAGKEDKAKLEELEKTGDKYKQEIDKAIEEGKYTENDLEKILKERNCMF